MNDAYSMFVRLTGGIADFTSSATQVPIVTGEAIGTLDPSILRVMEAYRASDNSDIKVINQTDLTFTRDNDYGRIRPVYIDTKPGPVRYMIIGAQRGKCKWVQVPEVDDTANLYIYRLPLVDIDVSNPDLSFEFDDVPKEHHTHLALWMRRCAHLKQDAETFDKGKSAEYDQMFSNYCAGVKAEWERYKHKNRECVYGGI